MSNERPSGHEVALIWNLDSYELQEDASTYPAPVRHHCDGFFSTLERAEQAMRVEVQESRELEEEDGRSYLPLRWDILAIPLDAPPLSYRVRRYWPDGTFRYEVRDGVSKKWPDFRGVHPEECSFQVGDFVELIEDGHLQIGIVAAQPPTPGFVAKHLVLFEDGAEDVYLVLLEEPSEHEHPDDGELMPPRFPVPPQIAQYLSRRLESYLSYLRR